MSNSRPKTVDLDAVIASVPVDKMAARQMSGGIHWTPSKKITQVHLDAPAVMPKTIDGADYTGRKFGRFTVVGLYPDQGSKNKVAHKGRVWQVRCQCGQYETRRSKAVRNPNNTADCCQQCRELLFIKRQEQRRLYGDKDKPRG